MDTGSIFPSMKFHLTWFVACSMMTIILRPSEMVLEYNVVSYLRYKLEEIAIQNPIQAIFVSG